MVTLSEDLWSGTVEGMDMIRVEEFEILLARHGSRLDVWPLEDRATAEELLQSSLEARRLLIDARKVDHLFQSLEPVVAPANLRGDILARVNTEIVKNAQKSQKFQTPTNVSLWKRLWPQMVGFAAASVLGVMIGVQPMAGIPEEMDAADYVMGYEDAALMLTMIEGQE